MNEKFNTILQVINRVAHVCKVLADLNNHYYAPHIPVLSDQTLGIHI